jgi:hypothetical protein
VLKSAVTEIICPCNVKIFIGGVQNRLYQTFCDIIKTEEHCVRLQEDAHCNTSACLHKLMLGLYVDIAVKSTYMLSTVVSLVRKFSM